MLPVPDPEHPIKHGVMGADGEPEDYDKLMEDGLGVEDGDIEEDEDEKYIADGTVPPIPDPVCTSWQKPLPPWLKAEFDARLAESDKRGEDGLPPLYRNNQTFWFPQRSVFFMLNKSNASITPQTLYNPRFFLWDPHVLCPDGIPCPNCNAPLTRHGSLQRPRRCIDQNSSFWIIGYRYRCTRCRNPSGKPTVTFCSWNQRILDKLPRALAHEFPAHLTRRSGISKSTFNILRSCLQSGMGTKQFSDALRLSHLLSYDTIKLQYLWTLRTRKQFSKITGRTFEQFLPFEDTSRNGYHGYIPSSNWLRDLYDTFIESHRNDINQHMSMLTANICALDHSHKVSKILINILVFVINQSNSVSETHYPCRRCSHLHWATYHDK